MAGNTTSTNFPTKNPFEGALKGRTDGFLAALDRKGSALTYATYLGGADADAGGVAVDSSGKAYVAGVTRADLAVKDPFQPDRKGASDGFVVKGASPTFRKHPQRGASPPTVPPGYQWEVRCSPPPSSPSSSDGGASRRIADLRLGVGVDAT